MALMIFFVFCVLGCIFLIFVLSKWTYGDKPRRRPRKSDTRINEGKDQNRQLFLVLRKKHAAQIRPLGGTPKARQT
jgi:hypothetical protein